jgi:hypothetical protein
MKIFLNFQIDIDCIHGFVTKKELRGTGTVYVRTLYIMLYLFYILPPEVCVSALGMTYKTFSFIML